MEIACEIEPVTRQHWSFSHTRPVLCLKMFMLFHHMLLSVDYVRYLSVDCVWPDKAATCRRWRCRRWAAWACSGATLVPCACDS